MISAPGRVFRSIDSAIFANFFWSFNQHARGDRNEVVDRICRGVKEKLFIGAIDISGSEITVAIVDENGRTLIRAEYGTHVYHSYLDCLHSILEVLQQMACQCCIKISGIGIGCAGEVNPIIGAFGDIAFLPGWKGNNFLEDLARESRVPLALENAADAATLAEALWGAERDKPRLIFVMVGNGIQGGVVTDGKLYRRADVPHPEMGHHIVSPTRLICSCGCQGCWESRAAGEAMVTWFKKHASSGPNDRDITANEICELAQQGNDLACRSIRRTAHYLGLGLINLIDVFEPDSIILEGDLLNRAPLFIDVTRKLISRYRPFTTTKLTRPSFNKDANLIAAAAVWHHRFRPGSFTHYLGALTLDVAHVDGMAYSKQ